MPASGPTLRVCVNLRARAYDPALLRFTSRDTFGGIAADPGGANRYAYAQGNPLRYTDPTGHFVQTLVDNPAEALALAVDLSPLGMAHWGASAALGYDPLTGRTLEPWERTAAAVAVAAIPAATREGALVQSVRDRATPLPHADRIVSRRAPSSRRRRRSAGWASWHPSRARA